MSRLPKGPVLRIHVTKEAITKAVTADSSKCWIAEAIKIAVPWAQNVSVDLATIRFSDLAKGLRYVYLTPYAAQRAIIEFDEGTPPHPFSFLLRNAHVTRAGSTDRTKAKRAASAKQKNLDLTLKKTVLKADRRNHTTVHASAIRRVGGRRPPQLRMLRQFGVRAFRGASRDRLERDQAIIARATEQA